MAEPDNFILRWARRKRESHIDRGVDNSKFPGPAMGPQEAAATEPETTPARPRSDAPAGETFDPSSLPSIEAITAETDVRGFLQGCVPRELTVAALRRAWTSDPAIRDFIGIAENQWDFNDPNAIPGFGPLRITGGEPAALTKVLGELVPGTDLPAFEGPALPPVTEPPPSPTHAPAQQNVVELASADTGGLSNEQRVTEAERQPAATAEDHDLSRKRRHHGSASPH
jgi:uncharacterized protein DUF3306